MVLSVIIVRVYDKSTVSAFFLFVSYTTFLTQVFLLGMSPFLNILAAKKIRPSSIYKEIIKKLYISIPITVVVLWGLNETFEIEGVCLLFLATVISGLSCVLTELMKGNGLYIASQLYNGGVNTLLFIILLASNKLLGHDTSVLILYLISLLISLVMNYYQWQSSYNKVYVIDISQEDKIIFNKILPIYLSTVVIYLFSQVDLWVVSKNFDSSIVAQYGLAIRLAALLSFSTLSVRAIAASRIPLLIHDKKLLQKEIYYSCNFSFVVSLLTLLSLLVLGYWLIGMIFGADYQYSWFILMIFAVGQIVNAATGPCDFLLSHTGHGISLMWITFISFILLIASFTGIQFLENKNVFLYCSVVSFIIAVQNLSVVYMAFKKTGILALPYFKREYLRVEK
ncbi:hypothetical protein DSS92_23865 [Salmonella enterica subsp. enterica]|nr:hypothetical protein [Salmonella enterica]EBS6452640.1 hypothetical protein [Salmonella enterica subsp. enterica serovar Offa]ECG1298674.1 hypothetical protein [Salmonella enterica subsp. enterica]EBJ3177746.1 hypothetical protein [Salmonella enterica]EBL7338041.1 hypothetical protein [Salmonella enterica]